MAQQIIKQIPYTGSTQRLTWTYGDNIPVTAYIWGAGGGGGGNDSGPGGYGAGGQFSTVKFTVNNGDVIDCAVGAAGGAGAGGRGGAGGQGGASYSTGTVFNTRTAVNPGTNNYTNGAYCAFLNSTGVWNDNLSSSSFDVTYQVNFPTTGQYSFVGSCDNYGYVYVDGNLALTIGWYTTTYSSTVTINAGTRSVRIVGTNTGGPGSIGVTIDLTDSGCYSGGVGGKSGYSGSSGAGGGGGGATVVLKNNIAIGVAGGGGGAGGGGNRGVVTGQHAPGSAGTAADGVTVGMAGRNKEGDGGGGGGGGGGLGGGNGGDWPGGDQGGYAGSTGRSTSPYQAGVGIYPGGRTNQYYSVGTGVGGYNTRNGTAGYAVFVFDLPGVLVHHNGSFKSVGTQYIKYQGVWKQVKKAYVKDDGVWKPASGGAISDFVPIENKFGTALRIFPPPVPVYDDWSYGWWNGGA